MKESFGRNLATENNKTLQSTYNPLYLSATQSFQSFSSTKDKKSATTTGKGTECMQPGFSAVEVDIVQEHFFPILRI